MKESNKKMEIMATVLQILTKESQVENSEQLHSENGNDNGNQEVENRKEENQRKVVPRSIDV